MTLRTSGEFPNPSSLRLRRPRLPTLLVGAALLLLTMFAGGSGAGVANYQGTLYLNGPPSAVSGSSFQLLTASGPTAPGPPTLVAGAADSGTLPMGNYLYVVAAQNGAGARAAGPSAQVNSVPANGSVNITNVADGSLIYRLALSASGATTYTLVSPPGGISGTSFTDNGTSSSIVLPQSENRAMTGATGWVDFTPGNVFSTASATAPALSGAASTPGTCTGWIVDASGDLTVTAGTWTFQARIKSGSATAVNAAANAKLAVALYLADSSGVPIATLIPPTEGSTNLISTTGAANTVTVSATTSSPTTIGTNEHLCVHFWRHQTTAYALGGGSRSSLTLLPYDAQNAITVHPAPNAFANPPTLGAPADSFHTTSVPTLSATYSDPEADAGTLTIRLCTDSGCSSSPQNSSPLAATNGATLNWTPTGPLADGTYYWQAKAQDSLGSPSAWTSSRSFVVDNVAPTTALTSTPPPQSNTASGSFSFSANESVAGYQCRVDAAPFAACSSPHGYGPLAVGSHTFDVKATADLAGNPGTTTNYGWTIDTTPPNTSITSNPSSLSNSSSASFGLSANEGGSTFGCSLDGSAFAACPNPQTYSALSDGPHTFQTQAVDPAGNLDPTPASFSWTIDATPPDTAIGPSYPAALTTATGATFDFSSTEPSSTFQCSLDGAAPTSCSTPRSYPALADGSHTFDVRATDTASNTDPSPASHAWTIDTTPPATSIGPTMPPANTSSSSATFDLAATESGSSFECRLDGGAFASCTTPASYTGLGDGTHTFDTRAADPVGNVDTSPASYTWAIDNVAPVAPALTSPADGLETSSPPQLTATFTDATAGDTGTVEMQICSSAAPAGTACAPVVQAGTSGSVSNGGTASVTPAALPDGTYHWQARARDLAGNQSAWSATRSFRVDTIAPNVPALSAPADGGWVSKVQLSATFSKPSFAGIGGVEFRLCSDALCLGVVRTGNSDGVLNGALASWSPSSKPLDGLYYWQARAHDPTGNASAWSVVRLLRVDSLAPATPRNFSGVVGSDGLTLRWQTPSDSIANYVVFVNGAPWKNFGGTEFEAKLGTFDAGDPRTFSVVAVDLAGNVGAMSPVLVGVPNLVGLTWPQALGAASARGLGLRRNAVVFASVPMLVASQEPPAPALAERGADVLVTMEAVKGAPLAVRVNPRHVACAGGSFVRIRVDLSQGAAVSTRLLGSRGKVLKRGKLGELHAGANSVRVKLPRGLRSGSYRLMLDAAGTAGAAHTQVLVRVGSRACRPR